MKDFDDLMDRMGSNPGAPGLIHPKALFSEIEKPEEEPGNYNRADGSKFSQLIFQGPSHANHYSRPSEELTFRMNPREGMSGANGISKEGVSEFFPERFTGSTGPFFHSLSTRGKENQWSNRVG